MPCKMAERRQDRWVVPVLEYFPMDTPKEPFIAPGDSSTLSRPTRLFFADYGNRVGAFLSQGAGEVNLKAIV